MLQVEYYNAIAIEDIPNEDVVQGDRVVFANYKWHKVVYQSDTHERFLSPSIQAILEDLPSELDAIVLVIYATEFGKFMDDPTNINESALSIENLHKQVRAKGVGKLHSILEEVEWLIANFNFSDTETSIADKKLCEKKLSKLHNFIDGYITLMDEAKSNSQEAQ